MDLRRLADTLRARGAPRRVGGSHGRDTRVVYGALAALRGRCGDDLAAGADLTPFEARLFSQNGEDGVLVELLRLLGPGGRSFVEFGVGNGLEGNCVALADVWSWSGSFFELDPESFVELERHHRGNPEVRTVRAAITAADVDQHFDAAGVPGEPDVMSIDVDSNDWWIWEATNRRPRILVIEYNGGLPLDSRLVRPRDDDATWDGNVWFGASLGALEALSQRKGYRLVHTDLTGTNAFFVRADLADGVGVGSPPRRTSNYRLAGADLPGDWRTFPWVEIGADGFPLG